MRGLLAHDVLDVWDAGRGRSPFHRALLLLAAADPGRGREEARALVLGDRDRLLLELRERTFGGELSGFVECPTCGERLELQLQSAMLRSVPAGERAAEVEWDGGTARLRAPTVGDLEDAIAFGKTGAYRALFAACVEARGADGAPRAVDELPEEVCQRLAARLAELDPAAETLLNMSCPACANQWRQSFDVASFLWVEVAAYAKRLLREVDALAAAYGWEEATILGMSAARRRAYLELLAERTSA